MKWTERFNFLQRLKQILDTYILTFFKTDLMKITIDEGIK